MKDMRKWTHDAILDVVLAAPELVPFLGNVLEGYRKWGKGGLLDNAAISTIESGIKGVVQATTAKTAEARRKGAIAIAKSFAMLAGIPGMAQAMDIAKGFQERNNPTVRNF